MSGLSRITNGIVTRKTDVLYVTYDVTRVYRHLTIDINKQKPIITIRPIKKQIHINVKREE